MIMIGGSFDIRYRSYPYLLWENEVNNNSTCLIFDRIRFQLVAIRTPFERETRSCFARGSCRLWNPWPKCRKDQCKHRGLNMWFEERAQLPGLHVRKKQHGLSHTCLSHTCFSHKSCEVVGGWDGKRRSKYWMSQVFIWVASLWRLVHYSAR